MSVQADEEVGVVFNRGRPNFGFGFGFGAEYGEMGTFGGHSVSAENSSTAFGALSVSACCSW